MEDQAETKDQLSAKMGDTISYESEAGEGTRFVIEILPLREVNP